MMKTLHRLHNFVARQSLYPLLLASLLAGGLFVFRVFYSRTWNYNNLPWNLFLAWVPYGFSLVSAAAIALFRRYGWLILFLTGPAWLLFFPNAPYIVTDFYHLEARPPVPMWYDIGLITSYAFAGCFLGLASLRTMHELTDRLFARLGIWGRILSWIFVAIALAFSALGIYLGRFGRFNSWDLFYHPEAILREIARPLMNPLNNLQLIGFVLLFTALLFVFYLMFLSFTIRHQAVDQRE